MVKLTMYAGYLTDYDVDVTPYVLKLSLEGFSYEKEKI